MLYITESKTVFTFNIYEFRIYLTRVAFILQLAPSFSFFMAHKITVCPIVLSLVRWTTVMNVCFVNLNRMDYVRSFTIHLLLRVRF